ncbi:MAG TPA: choice-of-anchor tandem repeat NxxGxxAF-containing protein [Candidatus Angelobacter sp.]
MLNILKKSRAAAAFAMLLALCAGQALAQASKNTQIRFENVADSTQGLSDFSQFPAINSQGSVAFVATQDGTEQKVFRSTRQQQNAIASTATNPFTFFTDDVVINDAGVVGFRALVSTGPRAAGIFTSDGVITKTIVNSADQGFPGFGIGTPSINASGTVAFQAFRSGFRSNVIFTGNGGSITPVLDTLTSDFETFGAVAINASGKIVFEGVATDRSSGIFLVKTNSNTEGVAGAELPNVIDVIDTNNHPEFFQFGDPVINNAGRVADFAAGGTTIEVFSGNGRGITARNDPANNPFIDLEHPSMNNHGAVAFSALEANGAQDIFVELTGGASLVPVLRTGDPLFGSTVTAVSVGRFAFNDHFRLVFEYELLDGRSGIAVAVLPGHEENEDE